MGAAALLCFIRDLFTVSTRESYNRADILVMLQVMSTDNDIFPCGIGQLIWAMDDEEEDEESASL